MSDEQLPLVDLQALFFLGLEACTREIMRVMRPVVEERARTLPKGNIGHVDAIMRDLQSFLDDLVATAKAYDWRRDFETGNYRGKFLVMIENVLQKHTDLSRIRDEPHGFMARRAMSIAIRDHYQACLNAQLKTLWETKRRHGDVDVITKRNLPEVIARIERHGLAESQAYLGGRTYAWKDRGEKPWLEVSIKRDGELYRVSVQSEFGQEKIDKLARLDEIVERLKQIGAERGRHSTLQTFGF